MKYFVAIPFFIYHVVAPLVGAWIEILESLDETGIRTVAPLVGAWIEIRDLAKSANVSYVAPLVGAWIEIRRKMSTALCRRSLLL